MDALEKLLERKREILAEMGELGDMRRGSVTEQFFSSRKPGGGRITYGPYLIYTYKEKGKTVSRRFSDAGTAKRYRDEIERFRRFESLSSELVEVSHRICEARQPEEEEESGKKKRSRPSPRKSGGRSKG